MDSLDTIQSSFGILWNLLAETLLERAFRRDLPAFRAPLMSQQSVDRIFVLLFSRREIYLFKSSSLYDVIHFWSLFTLGRRLMRTLTSNRLDKMAVSVTRLRSVRILWTQFSAKILWKILCQRRISSLFQCVLDVSQWTCRDWQTLEFERRNLVLPAKSSLEASPLPENFLDAKFSRKARWASRLLFETVAFRYLFGGQCVSHSIHSIFVSLSFSVGVLSTRMFTLFSIILHFLSSLFFILKCFASFSHLKFSLFFQIV